MAWLESGNSNVGLAPKNDVLMKVEVERLRVLSQSCESLGK